MAVAGGEDRPGVGSSDQPVPCKAPSSRARNRQEDALSLMEFGDDQGDLMMGTKPGGVVWGRLLVVAVIAGLILLCWRLMEPSFSPKPGGTAAPSRTGVQNRRLSKRFSRRAPPAITQVSWGNLVPDEQFIEAIEQYRDSVCAHYAENARRIPNPDRALFLAKTQSVEDLNEIVERFSANDVRGTAGPGVSHALEEWRWEEREPCVALAITLLLQTWPEAEPRSLLSQIASRPPHGSIAIAMAAVEAMGQTGRSDYLPALGAIVDPDTDPRVVSRALRAEATITGEAGLALRVADSSFPMEENLAVGVSQALRIADGPTVDRTLACLLRSDDPFRQESGLIAASRGIGMPAALTDVVELSADASLSPEMARHAVDAIREANTDAQEGLLLDLAANSAASPHSRAAAVVAMSAPPTDLALQVARSGPAAFLMVELAVRLERLHDGAALSVFQQYAGSGASLTDAQAAVDDVHDAELSRLARVAFRN